jgi:DNA modification methylase
MGKNSEPTTNQVPEIKWAHPDRLRTNPNNPRIIQDADFKKLVRSVREFPEMLRLRPIVVENEDTMIILGGNMRHKAAQAAGLDQIPYVSAEFLTEEQRREFIIKDNVGFGQWDTEMLANEWDENILADWGLDMVAPGTIEPREAKEDRYTIPENLKTDIQPGDIFQIGPHRLMCGDSTNPEHVALLMNGQQATLIFTDPPYGVTYTGVDNGAGTKHEQIINDDLRDTELQAFLEAAFTQMHLHSQDDAAIYCFFASRNHIEFEQALRHAGWEVKQELIWNKGMILGRSDYHWSHEPMLYGKKRGSKTRWFGDRSEKTILKQRRTDLQQLRKEDLIAILLRLQDGSTVWELDRDSFIHYQHPTQKPVSLAGRAMTNSSQEGEIVLDLFGGSGSSMVAGEQLDRRVYAMELKPEFCQVHINRLQELNPDLEITRIRREDNNG